MTARARLTYPKARGFAEISRLTMAVTGVEFTENFVETREDLLKLIDSGRLPFQQVPLLEIDGLELVESNAIVRYLARRGGIYGTSPAEQAKVDMYFEATRDFVSPLRRLDVWDTMPECEKARERYMPAFEKLLASSGTGYLVGSSLTFADVGLLEALLLVDEIFGSDVLVTYPCLKKFYAVTKTLPKISAYLKSPQRKSALTPESVAKVKKIFNL